MQGETPTNPSPPPDELRARLRAVADLPMAQRAEVLAALCHEFPDHIVTVMGHACGGSLTERLQDLAALRTPRPAGGPRSDEELIGTLIGPYKILSALGKGGMGAVYLAERKEPFRQRVALKIIRGQGSEEVLRRFEVERQALAVMNHDCIARVLDAGTTSWGHPFFVMEFVPGGRILTDYCHDNRLSLPQRLRLFQKVCAGVQHAHHKGVIHRDLKPNNILVTDEPGEATPKVIDFGLARATDHLLLPGTMHTDPQRIMGTPPYISPEQLDTRADVDTRSDVYALGVILYELLVEELPFVAREEMKSLQIFEIQRRILESEPVRPSDRIAERGDSAANAPSMGRTSASALLKALRSDLDWIALKAMEKDRTQRYDTAAELADDLERFLTDETIRAGPPSASSRLRKLVRRYRVQLTTAVVVLVTALIGAVFATVFAVEAGEQARLAQERTQEFDVLFAAVRLNEARSEAEGLFPAWPDKIDEMNDWLSVHWQELSEAIPEVAQKLAEIEARAQLVSGVDDEGRRSHARYPEFLRLGQQVRSLEAAQENREADSDSTEVELPPGLGGDAAALNEFAWARVSWEPTRQWGEERQGLAAAQAALRALGASQAPSNRAAVLDTLAWACFANGFDRDALKAGHDALDSASPDRAWEYSVSLEQLKWRIRGAATELRARQHELAELDRVLSENRELRFASDTDRLLHWALSRLLADARDFESREVRGVEEKLRWARRLDSEKVTAATSWHEAAEAIRTSGAYAQYPIALKEQNGLVPIGRNPLTGLWEFYHPRSAWNSEWGDLPESEQVPIHRSDGSLGVTPNTGIVFVLVPGQRFQMGAQSSDASLPNYEPDAVGDDVHEVEVKPFFLARHELTQAQWMCLSGRANPSYYQPLVRRGPYWLTNPVEQVSWFECREILAGHGLRLPWEKEWEYACRAGTTTRWATGSDAASLQESANLLDQSVRFDNWGADKADWTDGFVAHARVGSFRANGFGFFDVHGNVWEWCQDLFGAGPLRVRRGGGFDTPPQFASAGQRYRSSPDARSSTIGVRVARDLLD